MQHYFAAGAQISEMNCVRKHLSAIKGGRLAIAAAPAQAVSLIISDVPDDDLSVIASGPTVPDATTSEDALAILAKYKIEAPQAVLRHLQSAISETPKPGDARFQKVTNILVATPQDSLEAAAKVARDAGFKPLILGDAIEGESRDVALVHAAIAKQVARHGQPAEIPCALISGGETTVTVRGKGAGRAQRRVFAEPCPGPQRKARHRSTRGRHRWHRRKRGQCRRAPLLRHAGSRRGPWDRR